MDRGYSTYPATLQAEGKKMLIPPVRRRAQQSRLGVQFVEPLESRRLMATFAVDTFADAVSPTDSRTSLREAITRAAASAGPDTIVLPRGTYTLTRGQLVIDDKRGHVTIESTGGAAVIDANDASRVLTVLTPATLRGITLTRGHIDYDQVLPKDTQGGGIRTT